MKEKKDRREKKEAAEKPDEEADGEEKAAAGDGAQAPLQSSAGPSGMGHANIGWVSACTPPCAPPPSS